MVYNNVENQTDLRFTKTEINTKDKRNIHRTIIRDIFFHYTPGCLRTFIRKKEKKKILLKERTIEYFSCYGKIDGCL